MVANISRRERFAVFGLLAAAGRAIAQATGRTRVLLVVVLLIAGLAAAWWYFGKGAREIAGPARVVDGDTLVVAGEKIRIFGIDAPEAQQNCYRGKQAWACGTDATNAMKAMVAGRSVRCRPRTKDRYRRTVAVCFAGGVDLGAAMVKAGHAV